MQWSVQILPPCPLAKTDYLMRVYGATLFTVGIMQCAPIRTFLAHERLRALGRLSFPIYLTHWPIIFGVGSFSLVSVGALGRDATSAASGVDRKYCCDHFRGNVL